jgi:diadenosine tetraphosphate (Ap4A) HIT family hydrolase
MSTVIHKRVAECRAGENPRAVARVHSGWVVLGESQFLRGYSLVLPDPVVPDLNALSHAERKTLLFEASVVGDALLEITGAVRINYEILGNLDPALHVHVFPRFRDEPENLRTRPVWFYDWNAGPAFDQARDAALLQRLRAYLAKAGVVRD